MIYDDEIMNYRHDRPKPSKVREPVQVYLDRADQERLDRLTRQLGTNKSDVLRQALGALERELTDPDDHPVLRIIGIAGAWPLRPDPGYDAALEHDRFLAESEIASWDRPSDEKDGD
jgi:Arc/MetJ-type ribon-helix-helix transcriptional regulator